MPLTAQPLLKQNSDEPTLALPPSHANAYRYMATQAKSGDELFRGPQWDGLQLIFPKGLWLTR